MELRWSFLLLWTIIQRCSGSTNRPPSFTHVMNNLALSESTPVGEVVYQLQGVDPEGLPVKYGLVGTDKFSVDLESGDVTLVQPLDREVADNIKFLVSIEDQVPGDVNNIVQEAVTVIVLDENDNSPLFKNSPYEVNVPEDEAVGTTILKNISVEDEDSVGDNLEVGCIPNEQWPEACDTFEVVSLHSTANQYSGALVLKKPLDYNEKQFFQFQLYASDGVQNSTAHVEVKVVDVQNSPPVFTGSLSAALSEDAPVGTLALTVRARDADRAQPRDVILELVTNPLDFFLLDSVTGELRTAKPLDREALADPSSPLNLTVRATELVNGVPLISNITSTLATVTITIKDVNDEPPRFNRKEYFVEIPESLPVGTPLPNLDMIVLDKDLGMNAVFGLRLADDLDAFVVEPSTATGSASVTLRLNKSLDYEDPNQRKFILEVIAEEIHTSPKLSTKASVTVTVTDVNDNSPQFGSESYSAGVEEVANVGTRVAIITANDRDTGRFGTEGIVYEISGNGEELFDVDKKTGEITVAPCDNPGLPPCLDFETRKDYYLQFKATDDDGKGQSTVVPLQISVLDSNDNTPVFTANVYKASIDEEAIKFDPELQVQARDTDVTSELHYSIVSPETHPFWIDPLSGKITVRQESGGVMQSEDSNVIVLTVVATDGLHNATCKVEITVRDVNNHAPVFDADNYNADVAEDAPIGTEVAAVRATDLDSGINSEIKYSIQKGAVESFVIDNVTGVVTVSSKLNYDKRSVFRIKIIAADLGMPSLTGTTELTVNVIDVNDKKPVFTPATQRASVFADAAIGAFVHNLTAVDVDVASPEMLLFELREDRIQAVKADGEDVSNSGIFRSWFRVLPNGTVVVSQTLDREKAAVLTLPVTATDLSAPALQQSEGELIITIVDVNHFAPVFTQPAYYERMVEEQPIGTVLSTYTATDKETPVSAIVIDPPSLYFEIDNLTGIVKTTQRIDYEKIHLLNFTLVAMDSGVPQLNTSAAVIVEIVNANDESPEFLQESYEANLLENSGPGTSVVTVTATDKDEGEYGDVTYSLTGNLSHLFRIDPTNGQVTVSGAGVIDRETNADIEIRAVASDNAPMDIRRVDSVPIHIKVLDENDNAPVFSQHVYKSTISENLQLNPPAAILQVLAEDKDEGINGKVEYRIVEQTETGAFTVDPNSGIIYPTRTVAGNTTHHLTVSATDEAGRGPHVATCKVDILVLSVNKHAPSFVGSEEILHIPENAQADYLITTFKATDEDAGENGRVSYYLKVDNRNVGDTKEFSLNEDNGELRTTTYLDREHKAEYQLVVVAMDHGIPSPFESLQLVTVVLTDDDDNIPRFPKSSYQFNVKENLLPGIIIGTVKATDKDTGEHGKVYYHILEGNTEGSFIIDRTQGIIRANMSFDRETKDEYTLTVYASNNPILEHAAAILNTIDNTTDSQESSFTTIKVKILDENDNIPKFQQKIYYAGVKHTARINEPILSVIAEDPDLDENGTLVYMVAASNLYKYGDTQSSGSVVPSPFNISQDGILMTSTYMSEYNQDRFVLDIIAQEIAPPHRQAKTQVYVWIIDRSALIRMVVSRNCAQSSNNIQQKLSNAASAVLVRARTASLHGDWCEIHLHAVDPMTYQVLSVERVLESIDSKYDELKQIYQEYGVETLMPASATVKAPENFDPALAALIALLIVLFTGIVTFIVVCACLKHWVIPPPSMQSSKGDSLARKRILEELSTTENPLWLETKLRPYEEQELTMNVFGDQPEQVNVEPAPTDNTYATIPGNRTTERFGDYATLGNDSPTPLEAALGFQGSTFKPPSLDTPEPPPRPSAGLGSV